MKKLLLISYVILPLLCSGQNWSPISRHDQLNYRFDTATFITNVISIDSAKVESGDSLFFLNRIITSCPGCAGTSDKLWNQPQFLQRKMKTLPQGIYWFHDPKSYVIRSRAGLNESWVFDSLTGMTATVSSIVTETVFNQQDSVKYIFLSTGEVIRLSRQFGIIQFPAIGSSHSYKLDGIGGRNIGQLIPGFREIFNFNEGDIFQYHFQSIFLPVGGGVGGLIKKQIISKDSTPNGYSYGMEIYTMQWTQSIVGNQSDTNHTYDITVISYVDSLDHPCNIAPNGLVLNPVGQNWTWGLPNAAIMKVFQTGQEIVRMTGEEFTFQTPVYLFKGGDTLTPAPVSEYFEKYAARRGRTDYYFDPFEYINSETLIGYVIGGDTTGIIYPDTMLLEHVVARSVYDEVTVFPNPVSGVVYVTVKNSRLENIELFSADGICRMRKPIRSPVGQIALPLEDLSPGLYFLTIRTSSGTTQKKLIVR